MICMRIFVTMAVFRLSDAAGMEIDHICNTRKNQPEYDNLSVLAVDLTFVCAKDLYFKAIRPIVSPLSEREDLGER